MAKAIPSGKTYTRKGKTYNVGRRTSNALDVSLTFVGIDEVRSALAGVRKSVAARILKSATAYAIRPVLARAKSATPSRFGTLKAALISKVKRYLKTADQPIVVGLVGPQTTFKQIVAGTPAPFMGPKYAKPRVNKPSKYAHMVEGGTKPHFIPAPGYGLKSIKRERNFEKAAGFLARTNPGWKHPGAKAQPFLGPTARAMSATVIQRFRDQVLKRVDIEFKRAKAKGRKFWETDV